MIDRQRHAFTLLEIILSVALSAILMIAILALSANVRRTQAAQGSVVWGPQAIGSFERLLQIDMAQATDIQPSANAVTIIGYGRLDPVTLELRHGPTRVIYRLVSAGGHCFLLRQQTELDNRTNHDSQMEIVLTGVKQFAIEQEKQDIVPNSGHGAASAAALPPPRNWLCLAWEDGATPPVRDLLMLD